MKIEIDNYKCPSWNESNRAIHWAVRSVIRDEMKSLFLACLYSQYTRAELKKLGEELKKPVDIKIEAYFKLSNRRDPDNLFVKPILDGIVKAGIFTDDNGDVIDSLTLRAIRKMPSDKIIIYINE
ncbi:MAG TPA: hypothetical protein DDY52_03405 [Candidatus Moranbacteria bacterium]|nr:hypothetical protein [Candidatus Moranbacteria bacterium]